MLYLVGTLSKPGTLSKAGPLGKVDTLRHLTTRIQLDQNMTLLNTSLLICTAFYWLISLLGVCDDNGILSVMFWFCVFMCVRN